MSYTGTLAASFCRSDALFKKKEFLVAHLNKQVAETRWKITNFFS